MVQNSGLNVSYPHDRMIFFSYFTLPNLLIDIHTSGKTHFKKKCFSNVHTVPWPASFYFNWVIIYDLWSIEVGETWELSKISLFLKEIKSMSFDSVSYFGGDSEMIWESHNWIHGWVEDYQPQQKILNVQKPICFKQCRKLPQHIDFAWFRDGLSLSQKPSSFLPLKPNTKFSDLFHFTEWNWQSISQM